MDDVERLIAELANPNEQARIATVILLGEMGDARAVPALVMELKSGNTYVQGAAAKALGDIGTVSAASALADALKFADRHVRMEAAHGLEWIAENNCGDAELFKVVPALVDALSDIDEVVIFGAEEALRHIINGCDKTELLAIETGLKECATSLRDSRRCKEETQCEMLNIAKVMCKVAAKKNKLAIKENDGLVLSGERPKPPKGGGMYRTAAKQLCIR